MDRHGPSILDTGGKVVKFISAFTHTITAPSLGTYPGQTLNLRYRVRVKCWLNDGVGVGVGVGNRACIQQGGVWASGYGRARRSIHSLFTR